MAGCTGSECTWIEYRARKLAIVKKKFTDDDACDDKTKAALKSEIFKNVHAEVGKQSAVTAPGCDNNECACIKNDVDDDEGWVPLDTNCRWTQTITIGKCTMKATVTYSRETREVKGRCLQPPPASPDKEDEGKDQKKEPEPKPKDDDDK